MNIVIDQLTSLQIYFWYHYVKLEILCCNFVEGNVRVYYSTLRLSVGWQQMNVTTKIYLLIIKV